MASWFRRNKVWVSLFVIFLYAGIFLFQKDFVLAVEDLGRHLILGKIIVTCRCVPQTNLLSYTNPGFPFVNHHWFSEVVFYLLSFAMGINSLLFLKAILLFGIVGMMFSMSLKKGSLFWTVIVALLEIKLFSGRFHVRPELFSFLFISCFLLLFELYKKSKNSRWLFFLPLLELLWVNMHIYFPIGIGMYGLFLFEQLVVHGKKVDTRLFFILFLLIFATLINPNGWVGAVLPFTIFHNYGTLINENQNIWYLSNLGIDSGTIFTFEIAVVVLFISFIRKIAKTEIFSLSFALFGIVAGAMMIRNFPLFVLASWLPLVAGLSVLEKKYLSHIEKSIVQVGKGFLVILILLVTLFLDFTQALSINAFGFSFLDATQPAVRFVKERHINGPYFNNMVIGSYLSYAFYPKEKVFVDARPEAYPATFFDTYRKMETNPAFFDKQMNKYHVNALFISRVDSDAGDFIPQLLSNPQWVVAYKDEWTYIFVKKTK